MNIFTSSWLRIMYATMSIKYSLKHLNVLEMRMYKMWQNLFRWQVHCRGLLWVRSSTISLRKILHTLETSWWRSSSKNYIYFLVDWRQVFSFNFLYKRHFSFHRTFLLVQNIFSTFLNANVCHMIFIHCIQKFTNLFE